MQHGYGLHAAEMEARYANDSEYTKLGSEHADWQMWRAYSRLYN